MENDIRTTGSSSLFRLQEGTATEPAMTRDVPNRNADPGPSGVVLPERRDPIGVADEKFGFSPNQLFQLLNERRKSGMLAIGGLQGLCNGLRTDPKTGISADETELYAFSSSPSDVSTNPPPRPSFHARLAPKNRPTAAFFDRLRVFGKNRLPQAKATSFLTLMWHAFNNKLMFLLAASAAVSLSLGISQITITGNGNTGARVGWVESATIIGAIVVTIIATAANDYQKDYKFRKLNKRREERWVAATRSGKSCRVSVFDIVVGDLLHVEAGDVLAADGVLVEAFGVRCDESHLSGEAEVMHKISAVEYCQPTPGGFADPFLYSGSIVSQGVGTYIATAVGTNSTSGRIAMSLRYEVEVTPLQQRLAHLAKSILILGSVVGLLYFAGLFIRFLIDISRPSSSATPREIGEAFLNVFMLAITLVVIAVPEGLSLAVAAALAFTSTHMFRDNMLVKVLRSCEVMGSATTICVDKTGTLTCNEMTVVSGHLGHEESFGPGNSSPCTSRDTDESDINSIDNFVPASKLMGDLARDIRTLLRASIAANSTAIEQGSTFVGSSTEAALLKFAREYLAMGPIAEERANFRVVELFPFDADRKYMAAIIKHGDRYRMLVKGAAEVVLDNCIGILDNTKKHFNPREELIVTDLDDEKRAKLEAITHSYARSLLRPIAVAYRDLDSWPPIAALGAYDDPDDTGASFQQLFRHQLTFAAVFAIRDPLRPEAIPSIHQCQRAGVFVRMLTGDNLATGEATAMEAGIYTAGGVAMDGPTFRRLTSEQIDAIVPRLQVLARSNADDKAMLIMSLKRLGETVAATGDGTNDAFALKAADIGFSMGKSGTEVAKEASSIVVMDDNFASIVKAVAWGRNVTLSVKKYCQFQFTLNLTAGIITVVSTLVGDVNSTVFAVIQLLWLNLVMDILTALSFSMDFPPKYLMRRGPEPRHSQFTSTTMWKMIIGQSIYQLAVVFTLHYAGPSYFWPDATAEQVQTIVFNAYMFIQLFNQINCRRVDNRLDVFKGLLDNCWFLGVQAITILGQILVIFKGGDTFETEPLTGAQWGWSIVLGVLVIPVGAGVRCIPDAWFVTASHALKPLVLPLLGLIRWARTKRAENRRRVEIRRQKRRDGESKGQTQPHGKPRRHLQWLVKMLGRKEERCSPDVTLTAMRGGLAGEQALPEINLGERAPLDLLAAVEAAKYNVDGILPGLHVHPDTAKDDPVLFMPPTVLEILARPMTPRDHPVPPSQDESVMQYMPTLRSRRSD